MSTPLSKTELIVHPMRLRIVTTVAGRQLTTRHLQAMLPEVAQATLYRQINQLVEGGILAVCGQRVINGITEKVYEVPKEAAHLSREEFATITAEEHERYFAVFLGTLTSAMARYTRRPDFDVVAEGMTYFGSHLHLTDEEARQFRVDLLEFIKQRDIGGPGPGRRRRTLGVAFIPESVADDEVPDSAYQDPKD